MGLFGQSTPFDAEIDKATSETNTNENWSLILDVCDKVSSNPRNAKDCLKAIMKRMSHADPHVVMQAITLLDACANNCGKPFHLEIASREFENEFKRLLTKAQPKVSLKMRQVLKNWAENDFKNDPELNLIPSLYNKLRHEGYEFSNLGEKPKAAAAAAKLTAALKDPNVVSSQQEEDDIAKAIELSLKESKSSPKQQQQAAAAAAASGGAASVGAAGAASTAYPSLYPSFTGSGSLGSITNTTPVNGGGSGNGASNNSAAGAAQPEARKVRALYDFEAAEENELTFFAGEIIHVLDDSDPNWWKGFNQRGDGLFPSNFVSADLSVDPERLDINQQQQQKSNKKTVQFENDNDDAANAAQLKTEPKIEEIDEHKIERLLHLLHEANPEDPSQDSDEMLRLEQEVHQMGPLIDAELERVDRKHAQLTQLSSDLVDAINLYHSLMRDDRAALLGAGAGGAAFMVGGGVMPPGAGYQQMQFGPAGGGYPSVGGGGNFAPPPQMQMQMSSLPPYAGGQMPATSAPTATSAPGVGVYASHAQLQLGNEAAQQMAAAAAIPMQFQNGHASQLNGAMSSLPPHMQMNTTIGPGQQQQQHHQQMYGTPQQQQQQQQQAPPHQQNYQMLQQLQQQQQYTQLPQTIATTGSAMPPNATTIANNPQQQPQQHPTASATPQQQQFMSPQHQQQQQQHAAFNMQQHIPQQQFAPMPNGPAPPAAYMMQQSAAGATPVNHAEQQYNQLQQQMAAISMGGGVNQPVTQNFLVQNEPKNNIPIYQQQR